MNASGGLLTAHPHSWQKLILTQEEFQAKKKQILDL
jgi:hypothetical protein